MSVLDSTENPGQSVRKVDAVLGHFKALVDSSDDAIISKDLNGIIQTWNKGAQKIFGYTAEETIGKPVTILFPPNQFDEEPGILARIRAGERIDHYETVRRHKDGHLIDISLTVSPIKDADGKIIGASKIARDITERKWREAQLERTHEALKKANEEFEKANLAKDNFFAMLSHELRTPLNPVMLLASDCASNMSLPPEVRADFETILKNVEAEARIVDDLLDLARVRSGKLKTEKVEVNIRDVLFSSISMFERPAQQKGITLVAKVEDSESLISGDSIRLQQVFSNILRNAVKFTPPQGEITVMAGAAAREFIVQVSDTGIGMTPNELAVVFEPFKQGEHTRNGSDFGGLGLGLAISKQFVLSHGGVIEASSRGRGHGCTFIVKLPLLNEHQVSNSSRIESVQPGNFPEQSARAVG